MERRLGGQHLYRDALSLTVGGTLALGAVLAVLVGMSWRNVQRLEPVEPCGRPVQECRLLAATHPIPSGTVASEHAVPTGAEGGAAQAHPSKVSRSEGQAQGREAEIQQAILLELRRETERGLRAALAAAAVLPLLAAVFWALFRRRVLKPLEALGYGIGSMADEDFTPLDIAAASPVVRPALDRYNRMAGRIRDLEAGCLEREERLRRELEASCRDLLDQQALLARADRLAALADMAARMAHRLRSPLSGVLVTLTNLCEEPVSADQRRRLRLSIDALERSFRELAALTGEVAQDPEPARRLALRELVNDLFLLVRHRPEGRDAALDNRVPPHLVCDLPDSGTRHALMDLVANAFEAQRKADIKRIRVCAERLGDCIRIAVQDRGPGFRDSDLASLRKGANAWSRGGMAPGLAAARRFAHNLGGELILENLPAGGARATLILPAPTLPASVDSCSTTPQGEIDG